MATDDESMRVQLARMEGKLDLSNLRHDQAETRFTTIDQRLGQHGERLTGLEKREVGREGERRGVTSVVKAGYALGGSGIMGLLALVARHFGL